MMLSRETWFVKSTQKKQPRLHTSGTRNKKLNMIQEDLISSNHTNYTIKTKIPSHYRHSASSFPCIDSQYSCSVICCENQLQILVSLVPVPVSYLLQFVPISLFSCQMFQFSSICSYTGAWYKALVSSSGSNFLKFKSAAKNTLAELNLLDVEQGRLTSLAKLTNISSINVQSWLNLLGSKIKRDLWVFFLRERKRLKFSLIGRRGFFCILFMTHILKDPNFSYLHKAPYSYSYSSKQLMDL